MLIPPIFVQNLLFDADIQEIFEPYMVSSDTVVDKLRTTTFLPIDAYDHNKK